MWDPNDTPIGLSSLSYFSEVGLLPPSVITDSINDVTMYTSNHGNMLSDEVGEFVNNLKTLFTKEHALPRIGSFKHLKVKSRDKYRSRSNQDLATLEDYDVTSRDPRQPLEGILYKYTNMMKGWQFRWFVLQPETGYLEYHEREELKKQKPRGAVHLAGAVISPSDEDSQTFSVNAANGEIYKLRAIDAKERQHWVNRLRATAEYQTEALAQNNPPIFRDHGYSTLAREPQHNGSTECIPITVSSQQPSKSSSKNVTSSRHKPPASALKHKSRAPPRPPAPPQEDSFAGVKDIISQVHSRQSILHSEIEGLPTSNDCLTSLNTEMLLLKATSSATMTCLEQCLNILQQQRQVMNQSVGVAPGTTIEWLGPSCGRSSPSGSFVSTSSLPLDNIIHAKINRSEEVEDEKEYTDTDLGGVEDHKSIILHLLSQLKLGMDLTKVVLPTFILEKRSLLEMFADCMSHPDLFLTIPELDDPETRMLTVVEWYLTSFHSSRKGAIAKKPYNPIIGETFHCSWQVPGTPGAHGKDNTTPGGGSTQLYYCAEQVSHHPPISAFYFECPEKQVSMNASIWTKSKFMGMSIGVVMVGKVNLNLLQYNEEYQFSLPSAYARSILTIPWVELGDKVSINCPKTGYTGSVTFHTKPFYGGKLHRMTSEVRNPKGDVICRVNGEWNGVMEFTYSNGTTKVIDTSTLETIRKRVRPLTVQGEYESRKLWNNVTTALKCGDVDTATEHKRFLEERQRQGERQRRETNTQFPTTYFHLEGDRWVFNRTLKSGQSEPSV